MTTFQKKFGARVKELRKRREFTQEKFAELVDISVRSLGRIETGSGFPSSATLEKIIKVLDISFTEFFDFEHLQPLENLEELTINLIKENPDKIEYIYKVVKAIVS